MIFCNYLKHTINTQLLKMKQMHEINQVKNDEIDFFEFFEILWGGKWLISAFVAIAGLLGGGFLLYKDTVYESKLVLSIESSVPNKNDKELDPYVDFKNKFYSEKIFENWKESNSNTSLVYEDISPTVVFDGFVISKDKADQLVGFKSDLKNVKKTLIIIKNYQLPLVLDIFKYSNQINEILTRDYVRKAKTDIQNIDLILKNGGSIDGMALNTVLAIKAFVKSVEQGANVLVIERPTIPKKISPKSSLILAIFLVLGGMVGVFFIFVRNAITKRKEQLAKA